MKKSLKYYFIFLTVIVSAFISVFAISEKQTASQSKNVRVVDTDQYSFQIDPLSSDQVYRLNNRNAANNAKSKKKENSAKDYEDFLCFNLTVNIKGFEGELTEYSNNDVSAEKILNYYLFEMQNDLFFVDETGVKSPCIVYYSENANGLKHSNRFLIGFKNQSKKKYSIEYTNRYFDCGTVKFELDNPVINKN